MNKSESIKKLLGALAKAQQEFEVVRHDEENPYYKSRYASLGAVIASCRPILQKYGLTVIQPSHGVNGEAGIETIIFHAESGEWLSSVAMVALPPNTKKPGEEAGKAITYLRRYSLQSLLGVYSGDDDDLQSSGSKKATQKQQAPLSEGDGNVTPKWVVANKLAKSVPAAAQVINSLGLAGKSIADGKPRIELYREWRNTLEPKEAAVKAVAGEKPHYSDK